ncbi:MAG: phosphate transport system protein [Gaiellales bacterium]|jgi:phosphate transport system protein|nr:phosphate transport system protein [Gaiellales bacterium]MDX6551387.1 phosphate transport system protein [Gaiellales bacterium]
MTGPRQAFQQHLDHVEEELQTHGQLVLRALDGAVQALLSGDEQLADRVIAEDDDNDESYLRIEDQVQRLLALQTPVATDLRLILAILHVNLHLERMGDQCVNIAKLTKLTLGLVIASELLESFKKMGEQAELMTIEAMSAFAERDVERAERLVIMDSVINAENRDLARRIMAIGGDESMREAGLRAILISRCIERIGDNAVDIGERVAYLASGEFREFTDASHPGE